MDKRPIRLVVLGATGSVGSQTIKQARKLNIKIVGISFHTNVKLGYKIAKDNNINYYYCSNDERNGNCKSYDDLIKKTKPDLVVNAIIGFAGLEATIATLKNKIDLALANKESVVVAGWYIFPYAKKNNIKIIPIDSEHTNLYKQLLSEQDESINQIYITCSGGKYWQWDKRKLSRIKYKEAIKHKNWLMGSKITIDSNTLVNKCFEVIEAYWYFNTNRVNVLYDPTSLIHSAILTNDGRFSISHSKPDMVVPIAWAITDFQYMMSSSYKTEPKTHTLKTINNVRPIKWAYDVMNDKTNSLAIIINAADEVAIKLFKAKMLRFDQITDYIENSIKRIKPRQIKTIEDIYEFDKLVRLSSIKYWK